MCLCNAPSLHIVDLRCECTKLGESHRPLTPIHVKKYRDTPPISMAYLCKCMPSLGEKVVYTPPICITIRLPFVSRYFCGSIRVRGRWDTPNKSLGPGNRANLEKQISRNEKAILGATLGAVHRIRANPEKSDLVNFRGPDRRKLSELCVFCSFS